MAFTFRELKQARDNIIQAYGLDGPQASKVIGYYNGVGGDPETVKALIDGDLSAVRPALVALGITTGSPAAYKPVTDGPAPDDLQTVGGDDLHDGFGMVHNAPQKTKRTQADKRPTKQKKTTIRKKNDLCDAVVNGPQAVQGGKNSMEGGTDIDIVADSNDLPPGLHDDICAIIDGFADSHDIHDKQKIHPLQFGAACTLVGVSIKKRGILRDVERNKREGGNKYNPHKVLALLYLYEYICSIYKQVPFSHNFPKFAGVSREYFNDYAKQGLTSSQLGIAQKAHEIQRAGLVAAVTGGGSATVGNIFLSKALGGLQETVTIQHVSAATAPTGAALPVFGPDGDLLEDKSDE